MEEPIERDYVLELCFGVMFYEGDVDLNFSVSVTAVSPYKAVEKLIDSGEKLSELAKQPGASWGLWARLDDQDEIKGPLPQDAFEEEDYDVETLYCSSAWIVHATCEGEIVEFEGKDDINANLTEAFANISEAEANQLRMKWCDQQDDTDDWFKENGLWPRT
jgi:hypothetical protein